MNAYQEAIGKPLTPKSQLSAVMFQLERAEIDRTRREQAMIKLLGDIRTIHEKELEILEQIRKGQL